MKTNMRFLVLATMLYWLASCNFLGKRETKGNEELRQDAFYTDRGGFGTFLRVPLIKPYVVNKVSQGEWNIELQTPQLLELSIHNVQKVNVMDSIINVYAKGNVSLRGELKQEVWFVIIPGKQLEQGFEKRDDYVAYLQSLGIKEAPELYDIEEVYAKFEKDKKINWQTFK